MKIKDFFVEVGVCRTKKQNLPAEEIKMFTEVFTAITLTRKRGECKRFSLVTNVSDIHLSIISGEKPIQYNEYLHQHVIFKPYPGVKCDGLLFSPDFYTCHRIN